MDNTFSKTVLQSMPVAYGLHRIILDSGGRPCDYEFIEVNKKFEEFTGFEAGLITGRRATDVFPEIRNQVFDWLGSFGSVALGGTPVSFEQYSRRFGRWFSVNVFSPEEGYFVTLFTDITHEKGAASKASESEEKLRLYLDCAPLGIIVVSDKGSILEVNPEACRISGYEDTELFSLNLQRLIERSSRIMALMFFKDLLQGGEATCQLQIKTKWGELCWLSLNARTMANNRHTIYCQDITSYKELEDDLVESELLYRTFINASNDIIYLKDEALRYVIVNNALLDQFGSESSEIIGRCDNEIRPEEIASQAESTDRQVIDLKTDSVSEMTIDGKVYEAIKFPVSIANRKTGVGAYIRDVTEEKRQEEILKRTMERHRILANALLMSFKSSQEQLEYALQEALTLTGSQVGYIFDFDEERREMKLNSWTKGVQGVCMVQDARSVFALDETGVWGEVIRNRRPIVINDFTAPTPLKKGYPAGHIELKNYMSIPVILGEKVVAAVGLANKSGDYDDYDVYELSMLMNGVWTAVEKEKAQARVENLLKQTQAMFNEHDAVMLLIKPESGEIIDANPAAVSFYGYTRDELLGLNIDDIDMLSTEEARERRQQIVSAKRKFYSEPHRLKNGDKRIVDVYSCPITYNSETVLFSIIFDVTEREEAFDEIKYLSFHDHLTGLFNRRYFDSVLKIMNDERFMPLTVVMADVNGLKLVNDSFGHAEGDELLKKAAEVITDGCRKDDIQCRIGGDEFVIILPNTDYSEAGKIVRRIKKMQSRVKIHQLDLSMSFGYAVKHEAKSDTELIVSEAENRMYKNKMHESASSRNKTVSIIMKTLYEKCIGELEHSNRVSRIAGAIATELGLPTEQVNQISVAALLHDIGKIGIDDTILNKPGIFTKSDREEIEKHSESGWRILSNSDEYSALADYVLYHHETPDGKGYPRGIKGDSIPLESKIIAVSDAYDAMTNDRPYRKALTSEEAVDELQKLSGTQFDPDIVDVFVGKVLIRKSDYGF